MVQAYAANALRALLFTAAICSCFSRVQQQTPPPAAAAANSALAESSWRIGTQDGSKCQPGCYVDQTSSCPGGCTVQGSAGRTALCCTSKYVQRFRLQLKGAGQCTSSATEAVVQYTKRALTGLHAAMARSGSVMSLMNVKAVCGKGNAAIAAPSYFKDRATYIIDLSISYRGQRYVRDVFGYNHKVAGPCGGMFLGLCPAIYTQQSRQSCLYDRTGSTYSCDWLAQRSKQNPDPDPPGPGPNPTPSPSPKPSRSPKPNRSPDPKPSPAPSPPPNKSPDPKPSPRPNLPSPRPGPSPQPSPPIDPSPEPPEDDSKLYADQAILLETRNQLTSGDRDLLTDWRSGTNMCEDYWEGIYCYDSGPYKGAVQEIVLDYGALPGSLPAAWFNLTAPVIINLEGNQLIGSAPSSWQTLTSLTTLRLARNKLSGTVPGEWGSGMTAMQYMSFHNNVGLTGCIPAAFSSRQFYLYDSSNEPRSVGVGGEFAGRMNANSSSVLENTGLTGWCP